MTTAARPTWDTAKGGTSARERDLSALSKQYSSRDLPSHTALKSREAGQGTTDEHKVTQSLCKLYVQVIIFGLCYK